MRIAELITFYKEKDYRLIVDYINNEKLYELLRISGEFILPVYTPNKEKANGQCIIFTNIEKLKEASWGNVIICLLTEEEIKNHDNLFNLFNLFNLEIRVIDTVNFPLSPIAILLEKGIKNPAINELRFISFQYKLLREELNNYKGSRLKFKRLYETEVKKNSELVKELEDYKSLRLKYEDLLGENEKYRTELEDYKSSRLKFKRLYETEVKKNSELVKELEDYKGSRLKYKRLASQYEFKYNKMQKYFMVKAEKKFRRLFGKLFKKRKQNAVIVQSIVKKDDFETLFNNEKLINFAEKSHNKPIILLYGDVSLNVVDGSSIWLSSMFSIALSSANVILLSKANIVSKVVVSNFVLNQENDYIIIEPKELGIDKELSPTEASKILNFIDCIVPNIQLLIIRGFEVAKELSKGNQFKYRLIPYLTDIYRITKNGLELKEGVDCGLKMINHQAKYWLWQTSQMKEYIENCLGFKFQYYRYFPPVIQRISCEVVDRKTAENRIVIGYGGKIQPEWGILELILEVKKLNDSGFNIKLLIISSKISNGSDFGFYDDFKNIIQRYLQFEFIEYIAGNNREQTLKKLMEVDILYGFRPEYFEKYTLEISTKILESLVLQKPIICYPNVINQEIFGKDYSYFMSDISELKEILKSLKENLSNIEYSRMAESYLFEERKDFFQEMLTQVKSDKITIASHDFKFIDHFYSHLKSIGYSVDKDIWEWGEIKYPKRSEYCLEQSKIIFCEWGLANAVWYSRNITKHNKLLVRIHAQEVRQKAMKFGRQLNIENVDKIVFVSDRIRKLALDIFGWTKDSTCIIPNYVLTDDFACNNLQKKIGFNFGMVGITPQSKRLDRALDLLENILEIYPEAKLYIKGMRPEQYEWMHAPGRVQELEYYYKQYDRIEKNIRLKNTVIFDGYDNNMPEWYQKIDFILSPSDFESFHYALADGVASGCIPVIWNWEESDIIYKKDWTINNTQEALCYIQEIMHNKDKINQIRMENRNFIINKYGYEKIYHQLLELFGDFK